ncbi:MAG: diguanylate cyclase, partial [Caulobacter sp.]|nr:diguanylate cyclase [Caulobacter sp.]
MKITGARTEAPTTIRKRGPAPAVTAPASASARGAIVDSAEFLGLTVAELTPQVQAALQALMVEIDALRGEVARLKARLSDAEDLADKDVLTPILNRRAFVRETKRVAAFAQRYGSPASLVFFDLDGFKGVNDQFGHAVGDLALKAVADRLLANVRESDIVGRMGGDEFAVLLVQTDSHTAAAKAESLAAAVQAEPLMFEGGATALRISWGVRELEAGMDPEAALAAADSAMFETKRARKA